MVRGSGAGRLQWVCLGFLGVSLALRCSRPADRGGSRWQRQWVADRNLRSGMKRKLFSRCRPLFAKAENPIVEFIIKH